MAENLRLLRTLQRISDTARKINATARQAPKAPPILKSLPEHKPLLPLLLSHGVPSKLAEACANKYDKYANQLRLEAETRLTPHLVGHTDSQPSKVYSLFLKEYSQTLRDWAQIVLNSALKNLKRDSKELGNWDTTHPPTLWLPTPPNPLFACRTTQNTSPLSLISAPSHAFPTTYPPPHPPPSGLPPVEWRREPATSSGSPSSTYDLDSLCLQFTKSLVIDKNLTQPLQAKASIFSLPIASKEEYNSCRPCANLSKRRLSRAQRSQDTLAPKPTSVTSPLKVAKLRHLSVPPSFPSPASRTKPSPRRASAPAKVPTSKYSIQSPKDSDSICHIPTTSYSPWNTPTTDRLDISSSPDPSTPPLSPQWSLGLTSGQMTHTPQGYNGPTTPPALLPDLFPAPIVAPSTPLHLSPGYSLLPITDPFLQFQSQYDYFSDPSMVLPLDYNGSTLGPATGGFFSKSAFDTPPGFNHLSHGIPSTSPDHLENSFFNMYTVS